VSKLQSEQHIADLTNEQSQLREDW